MRLNHFDLNLLVVLDALLTERSATHVAARLHLTQPAISNALGRLRRHFGDDLLTHVGRELVPTVLGRSLAGPVRELLVRAGATVNTRATFVPASANRKFTLMASDYVLTTLLADVTRRTHKIAPGISFDLYPMSHPATSALEQGIVDVLVMPEQFLSPQHDHELLYRETFVCVVWAKNTLVGDSLTLEQLLKLRQVATAPGSAADRVPSIIDQWLIDRIGSTRNVDVIVGEFTAIPQFIVGTDRYAIMHRRLAKQYSTRQQLRLLPLPMEFPALNMAMQWNRHRKMDAGITWLRTILKTCATPSQD